MLGPPQPERGRNPDQNELEGVARDLLVAVRCLIPVGSRVKKMISDSWRADLAEEFIPSVYFWGLARRRGNGVEVCSAVPLPCIRLFTALNGFRSYEDGGSSENVILWGRCAANLYQVQKIHQPWAAVASTLTQAR